MATTAAVASEKQFTVERVSLDDYAEQLCTAFAAADLKPEQLCGLGTAELLRMPAGALIADPSENIRAFWILLEGEVLADKAEQDGRIRMYTARPGDSFGEVILLTGKAPSLYVTASKPSIGLRLDEPTFWNLMACCPPVRQVVLNNMTQRLQAHIAEAAHRDKLVSLGTLAAGLMHELHNPGSAAKRAASQLRSNLMRLQELNLRFCERETSREQLNCMHELQTEAIANAKHPAMSSLEQSDAEEAMAEWLIEAGVENAYRIAPALVGIGIDPRELDCARTVFADGSLSDALNWFESLVSSVTLVDAIEESVGRVSELVMAVKKFAYDDRCTLREIDVHDSIQSTLTILGHKMRQRQITVVKRFDATQPVVRTTGVAISQVWTNLLDNAIDASPDGAQIEVGTWSEPGYLGVCVNDHGSGIPPELRGRIFDPFYTTKPVGKGTGLGLDIVKRIVTQSFGGKIDIDSKPGETKFLIRLPQ